MATTNWTRQKPGDQRGSPQQPGRREALASEEYVVKTMPPILGTVDMTATYVLVILYITNVTTAIPGGAATFTYWFLGAVTFFIPCVIATAQLGSMFPYEGSIYNWTYKAFGSSWSFFAALVAWFPGVLVLISAGDLFVGFVQGLNSNWLVEPWQQGLVVIAVCILSGVIATQRLRMVQNLVNVAAGFMLLGIFLIGLAGIAWLLTGHPSATSFSHPSDWSISSDPKTGNLALFGVIALAYLGTEVPLRMGGEITGHGVIKRHLLWGTLIVLVGYLMPTFSVLVVRGQNADYTLFSLISTVDMALGKIVGSIVLLSLMIFLVMSAAVYNSTYARLLLVGAIDQRLPKAIGRLNKYRVPASATNFQTVAAAAITALIFCIIPYVVKLGKPADLSVEFLQVILAAATLMWAASQLFLFIDLVALYFRDRGAFRTRLIFPAPVLWISVVLGLTGCSLAIVDTLLNSWIPTLIGNGQWWYVVGGLTASCIIVAACGSIFASSEAQWEDLEGAENRSTPRNLS